MRLATRTKFVRSSYRLGFLIFIFAGCLSSGTPLENLADRPNTFRWIHPGSDPQLWRQIQSAFHDELVPDEGKPAQGELDVYRYKYLQKVGVSNHSVPVILGHRPAKDTRVGAANRMRLEAAASLSLSIT